MAGEILDRLQQLQTRMDLLISVSSDEAARRMEAATGHWTRGKVDIRTVPNRGRDIGPFLTEFRETICQNYEIVGHLHAKKSSHLEDRMYIRNWADFLYENLLGPDGGMADAIIRRMASDPAIGIVFADDPNCFGWDGNWDEALVLANRLNLAHLLPKYGINFPVGTMFWARPAALKPLFELGLNWENYPQEPLPVDGTMLHALERMLPIVAESAGFRSAVTHVAGTNR
jgi:lipopolysaccharide biosynthesis protein